MYRVDSNGNLNNLPLEISFSDHENFGDFTLFFFFAADDQEE